MSEEIKDQRIEDEDEEGINLLDYLIVLAKRKKLIISITLAVAIISGTISILSSINFYVAETVILPPQQNQKINLAGQVLGGLGLFTGGGRGRSDQQLMVELIRSRTVTSSIIKRFNLKDLYEAEDSDEAAGFFMEKITIQPSFDPTQRFALLKHENSPLIRISVADADPRRAANIANAVVEELKIAYNNIAISEATQRKVFYEKQLELITEALIKSEEALKNFHEETGILEVEAQTGIIIQQIASLQAQIAEKEVALQVIKSYSTAANPDVQVVEEAIAGLKKQLAILESLEKKSKGSLIPGSTMPELGLEYQRRLRKYKYNETLYQIMVKQYESAKIEEAKNTSFIHVVDKAVPPEMELTMRTWGGMKAMGTVSFAFIFSCFLALFKEYSERPSEGTETSEKLKLFKKYCSFKKNN